MAKKKEKKQYFSVVTPRATASLTYIRKPDTEGRYADDKYKLDLLFDEDEDLSKIEAKAHEAAKAEFGEVPDDLEILIKDGNEHKFDDYDGKVFITAKTKNKPKQVDAKRNPLPKGVNVGPGDIVKAVLGVNAFLLTETVKEGGKKKKVETPYVSFYLNGLQLLEKSSGGFDPRDAFEDEDGYEGSEDDAFGDEDEYKGSDRDEDYDPDDY